MVYQPPKVWWATNLVLIEITSEEVDEWLWVSGGDEERTLSIVFPYESCENTFLNLCMCCFSNKRKQVNKKL